MRESTVTILVTVSTCALSLVLVTAATMAVWTAATTVAPPDVAADVLSGIVGLAATVFLFYAMTWHARRQMDESDRTGQSGTGR